jgi:large subunit ribosomal protein L29
MKTHELRELTVEELGKRGRELRQEMLTVRLQKATGQLENPFRHKFLRKEVARIETILTERRIKAQA